MLGFRMLLYLFRHEFPIVGVSRQCFSQEKWMASIRVKQGENVLQKFLQELQCFALIVLEVRSLGIVNDPPDVKYDSGVGYLSICFDNSLPFRDLRFRLLICGLSF